MIYQQRSGLHHAPGSTAGAKAASFATKSTGPPRLSARGCSCGSARVENRFLADRTPDNLQTRASHAEVENDLCRSAVPGTPVSTALPVDTAVSAQAYASHRQVQHRQTSCPAVKVSSKRILA